MNGSLSAPAKFREACIRCAMLQPDPAQQSRLIEIIDNLQERTKEAKAQGWLGEIEGLAISIAAAEQKLQRMQKIVTLGLPGARHTEEPPGRT